MTDVSEIVDLLRIANGFDNRKPSEKMRDAWLEAAERAHWTFDEAADAIREHYSEQTDFIMPGHITALILRKRHQDRPPSPAARPLREVLDARNPDEAITTEANRRAFLAEIRARLITKGRDIETECDIETDIVDTPLADPTDNGDACLDERCPWCGSPVGVRCKTRDRPMRRRSCHPARQEAKIARLSCGE